MLAYDNAGGCSFTANLPNIITPNGDPANEYLVLRGLNAADWSITIFNRWGREILRQISCANQWKAAGQPAGSYFYLLTNSASGQTYKGWVEVVYWN